MNILIHDIAVKKDSGGVFTILRQLYEAAQLDTRNEYTFILGSELFSATNNIKIVVREDLQKSYIKRTFFDFGFGSKQLLKYNPDVIVSMQNTSIFGLKKAKQYVYLHQTLPFQNRFHFSMLKKAERKLFFYQYIVGAIIKVNLSLNKNAIVIVQSNWLKNELVRSKIKKNNKIDVLPPKLTENIEYISGENTNDEKINFFYPSTAFLYKNHKIIIESLKLLSKEQNQRLQILLTINKNEFENLVGEPVPENVILLGRIEHREVLEYMSKSILLFPSQIESFGLPIMEAKSLKRPILINDIDVLNETVGEDYKQVVYFDADNPKSLAQQMLNIMMSFGSSLTRYVSGKKGESTVMKELIQKITN